jgi:protein kinase A
VKEFSRIYKDRSKDPSFSHYDNERRVLTQLKHPFIRPMNGFLEFIENFCIFLEYVPGPDLLEFIMYNQMLDINLTKFYAIQIAMALQYIHKNDFVFVDLKPENIVVDSTGKLFTTHPTASLMLWGEYKFLFEK